LSKLFPELGASSEIVREALRDWRDKRALQAQELGELRAKVQDGVAEIEAGGHGTSN
jgi:antitoxin ParD1/3/4